jgi:HK97 family phage prohead protease
LWYLRVEYLRTVRADAERIGTPMPQAIPTSYEIRDSLAVVSDGDVEFRAVDPAEDRPGFDGYITTWNTVDDRGTAFAKGAFRKTIRERLAIAPILANHDGWGGLPIGKHISAKEDSTGVRISAALSETTAGQDALRLLRDGVPLGLSFGFDRLRDRTAEDDDQLDMSVAPDFIKKLPKNELRVITEVRLWESSLVTFPANAKAKPDTIRSMTADDLPLLLDAIKAGTLTTEQRALIAELVAAYGESAAAGESHGTPEQARRNRLIELESLFMGVDIDALGAAA